MKFKKKRWFKDAVGIPYVMKRFVIVFMGAVTYSLLGRFKRLQISGAEHLKDLPKKGVLFISNHQTYFADVITMFHIFSGVKNGFVNTLRNPIYLFNPKTNVYYVAAKETMRNGLLPRFLSYSGCIAIKRTWRELDKEVNRKVDLSEISLIGKAINDGWVINFPQGNTTEFSPGRRGVSHLISKFKPIVIPIVIDGFKEAYGKKGMKAKNKNAFQKITFKPPLSFDYENDSVDTIMSKVMNSIEQTKEHQLLKRKSLSRLEQ